ncbi:MAG: 1-acyl-sn-glycerol-3-phosphate acyltransferase [Bacteroidia bacterium]|nr:1-acyl-sn-glycerol-3-phosphate acyltransferase [Bacteroidia bacterium]
MLQIFAWFFKLKGWKIKGHIPPHITKCVIIAAPHTSNWDFVFALGALKLLKYKVNYLIKKEVFVFPFSILLKRSGAIAVDRKKSHNVVVELAESLNARKQIYLMMAAEGTRKRVNNWKSGFYYLALKANVPVCTGYLDYAKKEAGFGPVITLTGNHHDDMQRIKDFYSTITPCIPENFNQEGIKIISRQNN